MTRQACGCGSVPNCAALKPVPSAHRCQLCTLSIAPNHSSAWELNQPTPTLPQTSRWPGVGLNQSRDVSPQSSRTSTSANLLLPDEALNETYLVRDGSLRSTAIDGRRSSSNVSEVDHLMWTLNLAGGSESGAPRVPSGGGASTALWPVVTERQSSSGSSTGIPGSGSSGCNNGSSHAGWPRAKSSLGGVQAGPEGVFNIK